MRLKRPKWILFQLTGAVLLAGVITLGYYQYQWISTATRVEKQRILKEISISAERGLDSAFDEIRALISFAYVSPDDIRQGRWTDVDLSLRFWSEQSPHPDLLTDVMLVPTTVGGTYMRYGAELKGFAPVSPPPEFSSYDEYLGETRVLEAYQRAYPALRRQGYLVLPVFPPDAAREPVDANGGPIALLSVLIDTDLLLTEVLPSYLNSYLGDYRYRIVGDDTVHYSTLTASEAGRRADVVVPIYGAMSDERDRLDDDAMRNPISRFWFLRTEGVPGIERNREGAPVSAQTTPRLEVYHPDTSLRSAMRGRQTASLLLGIGTLLVLLIAYFVLYILLTRTHTLRMTERDFVTSMSHELRTPLSVISATSDNLSRGIVEGSDRVRRYGGLINTQAQRLGRMVESILLYSGIEMMDSNKVRLEEIRLPDFFAEIISALTPTAEEAGARLVLARDTGLSSVSVDGHALRIIAENLMMNAIRHGVSERPGVDTNLEMAEIRVIVRTRPPRSLLITVEDDGPGVSQSEAKTIFEPFSRGDRSKADQTPGSGLGLHIVRRICTQMGGNVSVESPYKDMAGMPRRGARFVVKIPVRVERKA